METLAGVAINGTLSTYTIDNIPGTMGDFLAYTKQYSYWLAEIQLPVYASIHSKEEAKNVSSETSKSLENIQKQPENLKD